MIVRVKDVVAYLSTLDPDMVVELDKDGWMEGEIPHQSAQELVAGRGLFRVTDIPGYEPWLIINN